MKKEEIDLSKWAVVAHKDDCAFARQARDIRSILGIGYQLVIPSERLFDKPLVGPQEKLLDPKCDQAVVSSLLQGLQGIVFFERHNWHPALLAVARSMGTYTVCAPNWEWFRGTDKQWSLCDLFVCTNQITLNIVRGFGFNNSVLLPLTQDIGWLPARKITGPARLFVHNAGLVNADDRKGTRDTIEAFKLVKRRDIRLMVRLQKAASLPKIDERIEVRVGSLEDSRELYADGDVMVQPSKLEGACLTIIEPVACGLPVITLDYPPMNEYVRHKELLVKKKLFKRRAFPTAWVKHAHLRLPDIRDLARKIEWCAENDLTEISAANRRWAENMFDPGKLNAQWHNAIRRTALL